MKKMNLDFEKSKKIWLNLIETTINITEIENLYHYIRGDNNSKMYLQTQSIFLKQFLKSKKWTLAYNLVNIFS